MRIVIVGGVAGGANVATRARRLSEEVEIVLFERGEHVSFANCGLPYHIGGEISDRNKLLVQTAEGLRKSFNIDVRELNEVTGIDKDRKVVNVKNLTTGNTYEERYDHLVLSPGASPLRPSLPGLDLPGIFSLRDMADMDRIIAWINTKNAKSAVIAGGGFIGLEVAEQLHRLGMSLTVVDSNSQLLMPFDPEMSAPIARELLRHKINLVLSDSVASFNNSSSKQLLVTTKKGAQYSGDIAILSIGVKPESELARQANLELGERGAIVVNEFLQTSDPNIWALGDCIQLQHRVSGKAVNIALAGPANRCGRLVADNILGNRRPVLGPLGTAIIRVFDLTAACTGINERTLRTINHPYQAVHLHPNSHAGYFPNAHTIALKLLFDPKNGKILGAQAVGKDGVDKRIDVIATAIAGGLTVDELVDIDLCYAPPFGSAKDPVNMAGMIASNIRAELVQTISWEQMPKDLSGISLIDVRTQTERDKGFIPGSIHIPLVELRSRIGEIPKDRKVIAYCQSGQRSYNACRILVQHGFECMNLSGAFKTWSDGDFSKTLNLSSDSSQT
jgi:NADPH-dependent 2,4-dienoyl-CoA reductase/sulfur reductase-like enzyme/rhodanese-related sulfurtransferase